MSEMEKSNMNLLSFKINTEFEVYPDSYNFSIIKHKEDGSKPMLKTTLEVTYIGENKLCMEKHMLDFITGIIANSGPVE